MIITDPERQAWDHLYRELARLQATSNAYGLILGNIEINGHRYNAAFQLILDGFTRSVCVGFAAFYDTTKGVHSLAKMKELDQKAVKVAANRVGELIGLRNKRIGHVSKSLEHRDNLIFLSTTGVTLVNQGIKDIKDFLDQTGAKRGYNLSHALKWIECENGYDFLIRDLSLAVAYSG